jgi:hypothetical protein
MADDVSGIKGEVVVELRGPDGELKAREVVHNLVTDTGDQVYGARAFNAQGTAKTITAITTGTTATVTTSAAHGFSVGDVVVLAGVTPTGYNGSWAITAVPSTTTFSIYVGTALGAGTAFGTATGQASAAPSGMKLGTGSTAVAKNGAGAALVTYLTNSQQGFDGGFPTAVNAAGTGTTVTYRVTYAAGKATSASAITECVIVNEAPLADATTAATGTLARVLLTGIGSKGASDTLTVTWTHKLLGA